MNMWPAPAEVCRIAPSISPSGALPQAKAGPRAGAPRNTLEYQFVELAQLADVAAAAGVIPQQWRGRLSQTGHHQRGRFCRAAQNRAFSREFRRAHRIGLDLACRRPAASGATAMAIVGAEIERLIKHALPDAQVVVVDLAGDGSLRGADHLRGFQGQEPDRAAQDGLRRAAGADGRSPSCAGARNHRPEVNGIELAWRGDGVRAMSNS